jgi:hypothetical protein
MVANKMNLSECQQFREAREVLVGNCIFALELISCGTGLRGTGALAAVKVWRSRPACPNRPLTRPRRTLHSGSGAKLTPFQLLRNLHSASRSGMQP